MRALQAGEDVMGRLAQPRAHRDSPRSPRISGTSAGSPMLIRASLASQRMLNVVLQALDERLGAHGVGDLCQSTWRPPSAPGPRDG